MGGDNRGVDLLEDQTRLLHSDDDDEDEDDNDDNDNGHVNDKLNNDDRNDDDDLCYRGRFLTWRPTVGTN